MVIFHSYVNLPEGTGQNHPQFSQKIIKHHLSTSRALYWFHTLVGGWAYPSEKKYGSVGMIIPNIWKFIKFMFQSPPIRYGEETLESLTKWRLVLLFKTGGHLAGLILSPATVTGWCGSCPENTRKWSKVGDKNHGWKTTDFPWIFHGFSMDFPWENSVSSHYDSTIGLGPSLPTWFGDFRLCCRLLTERPLAIKSTAMSPGHDGVTTVSRPRAIPGFPGHAMMRILDYSMWLGNSLCSSESLIFNME